MKRMIPAAVIAVGLHALMLAVDLGAFGPAPLPRPLSSPVTLSLTYFEPVPSAPLPAPPVPEAKRPKSTPVPSEPPSMEPKPSEKPEPALQRQPAIVRATPPRKEAPPPLETPAGTAPLQPENDPGKPGPAEARIASVTGAVKKQIGKPVFEAAVPLYRENPAPRYPRLARSRGHQGVVVLDVRVNRKGKVETLKVAESSGHGSLDRAAMASVKDWSFEPARRENEPVEMWVRIPIRFQLE